jgi:hypothetical protein
MGVPDDTREYFAGLVFLVMSGPIATGVLWHFQATQVNQLPTVAFVAVVWLQAFPWVAGYMMTDNPFLEKVAE